MTKNVTKLSGVKYVLMDGVEQNRLYPDTFEIPSDKEKAALRPGDYVKLCFEDPLGLSVSERMWVQVIKRGTGRLMNTPLAADLEWGDMVDYEDRHVLSVMRE